MIEEGECFVLIASSNVILLFPKEETLNLAIAVP
jgi:hypothetical protein